MNEIKNPTLSGIAEAQGIKDNPIISHNNHSSNPLKAIRAKCIDCCCDSPVEVRLCPCTDCALYPFRFGSNPFRVKRVLSAEQREKATERLAMAREARRITDD